MTASRTTRYVVPCGGVGGSPLVDGLAQLLPPAALAAMGPARHPRRRNAQKPSGAASRSWSDLFLIW